VLVLEKWGRGGGHCGIAVAGEPVRKTLSERVMRPIMKGVKPTEPPPIVAGKAEELTELCRQFHVKRLEIFGSAVTGAFRSESSDLDFIVDFGDEPLGPWAGRFLDFADALESLFGRHVDLIMPSSIRNPYFRQAVDASRRLLYEA
jgi:predicted nucleotidyltransferase